MKSKKHVNMEHNSRCSSCAISNNLSILCDCVNCNIDILEVLDSKEIVLDWRFQSFNSLGSYCFQPATRINLVAYSILQDFGKCVVTRIEVLILLTEASGLCCWCRSVWVRQTRWNSCFFFYLLILVEHVEVRLAAGLQKHIVHLICET